MAKRIADMPAHMASTVIVFGTRLRRGKMCRLFKAQQIPDSFQKNIF